MFLGKTVLFSVFLIVLILLFSDLFQRFQKKESLPTFCDSQIEKHPTVILDAGHGGMDSGAVSVLGEEEKNINLAVVKKIGAFLEEAGICVLYTRTEDVMLTSEKTSSKKAGDLLARVELAKENPEAVFISIHMNTLPIEKYKGLQVFYSDNHSTSRVLAQQIQNDAKQLLQKDNNRNAKNAMSSIYILDRITTPAVLVECGFISNHEEASLLVQEDYQKQLAFVISRSVISFMLQKENS